MDNTTHLPKLFLYLFLASVLALIIQHKLYLQYQKGHNAATNYFIPKTHDAKQEKRTELDIQEMNSATKSVIPKLNGAKLEMRTNLDIQEMKATTKYIIPKMNGAKQEMKTNLDIRELNSTTKYVIPEMNDVQQEIKTDLEIQEINSATKHVISKINDDQKEKKRDAKQEKRTELDIQETNSATKNIIPKLNGAKQEMKTDLDIREMNSATKYVIAKMNDVLQQEMKTDLEIQEMNSATKYVIPEMNDVQQEMKTDLEIQEMNSATKYVIPKMNVVQQEMETDLDIQEMNSVTKHVIPKMDDVKQETKRDLDIQVTQAQYRNEDIHKFAQENDKRNQSEVKHMDIIKTRPAPSIITKLGQRNSEHTITLANSSNVLNSLKDAEREDEKKRHDSESNLVKTNDLDVDRGYVKAMRCRKLPDVLIIGFEKCGTITLKSFLGIHPQIFVPSLHQNYNLFNTGTNLNVAQYTRNQKCTPGEKLRLEKLSTWGTALKTYRVIPKVKLIAIVREPVDRTMSHFVHRIAIGKEKKPYNFDKTITAIMNGKGPIKQSASVLFRQSQYIDRLRPWISKYGMSNIHIVDGDAFAKHPALELQKVELFLGLKPYITEANFVYNEAKTFYCLKDKGKVSCMSKNKGRAHRSMSEVTRTRLQRYYQPFNEDLFKTLGRRFSWSY